MKKINEYKYYIFDLDGTLLESMELWQNIYIDVLKELDIKTDYAQYLNHINHLSVADGAKFTVDNFDTKGTDEQQIADRWNLLAKSRYDNDIRLKDGAYEFLTALKEQGKILGIATSLDEEHFVNCLKRNGIFDYFSSFTTASEAGHGKDNPKIYLMQCEKLGAEIDETIVFEDSLTGIKSAASAGFGTAAVEDKTNPAFKDELTECADFYINSYRELL